MSKNRKRRWFDANEKNKNSKSFDAIEKKNKQNETIYQML